LPAYQDYTIKSKATSALAEITPTNTMFEVAMNEGNTPAITAAAAGFVGVTAASGQYCAFTIGATPLTAATATITCALINTNPLILGYKLTMERVAATGLWACKTDITQAKYRPGACIP
ncbi:MAG: pilin, partial [Proteobacteria bacterium]|nr:pilin [Pseudomonadota bacterium]